MATNLPYCGLPPIPGELLTRFNWDPILVASLLLALGANLLVSRQRHPRRRAAAGIGWLLAALALISPLCALSVALFAARLSQHMILILVAAPLIAWSLPARSGAASSARSAWTSAGTFFIALWFWHMPRPYDATFESTAAYWCMHLSLFATAVWLWRELLNHDPRHTSRAIAVGALSSMQMGFLGAFLTLAARPLYFWHLTTTQPWGLTALEDQQLGGVIMWVPGIALFLWAAMRSLSRLLKVQARVRAA
jgi:putative membrane protein